MLETGWTEDELALTSPVTVAKLRHALYARAHKPAVTLDIDAELAELADASLTDAKAIERRRQSKIHRKRDALSAFRKIQRQLRELLHLDDPEPIPEDEP